MKETFPSKFEKEISEIKENIRKIEEKYHQEKKVPPSRKEILKEKIFKIEEAPQKVEKKEEKVFFQRELDYFLRKAKKEGIFKTIKEVQETKNPYLIDAFHDEIIKEIEKNK